MLYPYSHVIAESRDRMRGGGVCAAWRAGVAALRKSRGPMQAVVAGTGGREKGKEERGKERRQRREKRYGGTLSGMGDH